MSFFEISLSLIVAFLVFLGLFSLGLWIARQLKLSMSNPHGYVALGFGGFYFLFFISSLLFPPGLTWYFVITVLFLSILLEWNRIVEYLPKKFSWKNYFLWFLVLLFIPYFFRLFAPPESQDGLSHYLPSIAWIFNKGLEFNPYLTNYTTMPQGVEYLFTIPYGISHYSGVRALDALGTFALLHLLYSSGKKLLSKKMAILLVLLSLYFKGAIFTLFSSGKIDTWNTYLILVGIFHFLEIYPKKNITGVFLIFSIALGVKYTNWLLLILPLIYLFYILIRTENLGRVFLFAVISLFFAGSVMIRNQIQVNNPLAPIYITGLESRFIEKHLYYAQENSVESSAEHMNSVLLWIKTGLKLLSNPIWITLVFFPLILFLFRQYIQLNSELGKGLILIFLMFFPWYYILGSSLQQPVRFILAPLLLQLVVSLLLIERVLNTQKAIQKYFYSIAIGAVGLRLLMVIYLNQTDNIINAFLVTGRTLPEWYSLIGKDSFAISYRFKELGLHHKQVQYKMPVALGAFDIDDYGNIPKGEELMKMRSTDSVQADFIFDFGKEKLDSLKNEDILVQFGEYFVRKVRKEN